MRRVRIRRTGLAHQERNIPVIHDDAHVFERGDGDLQMVLAPCLVLRCLPQLANGDDAPVRPCTVWQRGEGLRQILQTNIQNLFSRDGQPRHSAAIDGAGIFIRQIDAQLNHVRLNGKKRILPLCFLIDGQVRVLRGGSDLTQFLEGRVF